MTALQRIFLGYREGRQVKVSFYRLDPKTKRLIIYNNEQPCQDIQVIVKDWDNTRFIAHIGYLQPNQEYQLPFDKLINMKGQVFDDQIKSVTVLIANTIETFHLRGREFHRA